MKKLYSLALGQKEKAKHGDAFFPVQKYITRLSSDSPVVTTHWHEEAELTLITKGNCRYQIDLIKNVLDYIEIHFAEWISVSELARLCYFSDYHFMRFFKKYMNMTCVEYINNLRLEKAVELFEQGNTSIIDVSLSVGFHNLSYFHRAFKKKYHMTPLSFIRKLKEH